MKVTLNTASKRQATRESIRTKYAKLISQIVQPYRLEERETWFTQLKEADEYLIDPTISTPLISAMATARGISVETLALKIKENDDLFKQVVGTLLGQQQAELDLLD